MNSNKNNLAKSLDDYRLNTKQGDRAIIITSKINKDK